MERDSTDDSMRAQCRCEHSAAQCCVGEHGAAAGEHSAAPAYGHSAAVLSLRF